MQSRVTTLLLSLALLVLTAGCAPAGEHKVWRDPGYAGGPLKKVFVIGLSSTSLSDRRGFEDMMVGQIQATGGQAVPGYQFIPQGVAPDDATIAAAVARSGADGVLISRMAGLETRSNALQNPYPSRARCSANSRVLIAMYSPRSNSRSCAAKRSVSV